MKIVKKVLIGIIVILTIIIVLVFSSIYMSEYKVTDISQYKNPNNNYTILFQEVGDPQWPFGPSKVKVTLLNDKNEKVKTIETNIANDGMSAHENNISVSWFNDYTKITLCGSEQEDIIYTIDYI